MTFKHILTRIFKKYKNSGSPNKGQETVTAPPLAPASQVIYQPSYRAAITQSAASLVKRSSATQQTFPLNVTLRWSVILSPTDNGVDMSTSLLRRQAFSTPSTICEGPTFHGPVPLLETSLANSPTEFNIESTSVQPGETVDTTLYFINSSDRGPDNFSLGSTCHQDEQPPSNTLMDTSHHGNSTTIASTVVIQPLIAPVTPAPPPLPLPTDLARTTLTIENKDVETLPLHLNPRPLVRIAGLPVGFVIPSVEAIAPSTIPTISKKVSLQSNLRLQEPLLEKSPPPAPRWEDENPRHPPGLQAGYFCVQPPGIRSPCQSQQQIPRRNLDNSAPLKSSRGQGVVRMSPNLGPVACNAQSQDFPQRADITQAGIINHDSGTVTVQRISNNKNIMYSIRAGGHKYIATAQVGSGGFGYVWYAIKDDKEEVAIKVVDKAGLLAQFVCCNEDERPTMRQLLEGSSKAIEAINAEYEAFKRVTEERSPFLTPLLHAFEDEENFYFVMRFYPQTLRTRARFGFMHWQLRLVAAELLLALQHLHKLRIVHLDLKMENVLVTPSGHISIADFGNAQVMDRMLNYQQFHDERMYGASGTDGYLPSERFEGNHEANGYNFKTDTWTYGTILLELLLINGGHWYSIYHHSDGTHKFGRDRKIPAGYDKDRRLAFIRPREEINLVHDNDAKDLLLSIFVPQYHNMRPEWESIRGHPFFACIDWKKLECLGYDPMFKACLGNVPLQSVDCGKLAIKRSNPQLPEFKNAVLEQEKDHSSIERMRIEYKCPTKLADDVMHGATCRAPGSKMCPRHVCRCDLPTNWNKPA